jgi:carbonic anhydrase
MKTSDRLLLNNKSWVLVRIAEDPDFFKRLAKDQRPEVLWIGCSDSRVPANQITGTGSGEIFVHRNIANLFVPTDLNLLSVLQYAVSVLEVQHVIVCGHYGCGGVRASMSQRSPGEINHWLRSIRDVYEANMDELRPLDVNARAKRLCELNVHKQVERLAQTSVIRDAWEKRGGPWLHGWVYGLEDGRLRELAALEPGSSVGPEYPNDV